MKSLDETTNTVLGDKLAATAEGQQLLEYWNTINLLYGVTDIGINLYQYRQAKAAAKSRLVTESSDINNNFDEIADEFERKLSGNVVQGAGDAIPNLLNKVDNVIDDVGNASLQVADVTDEIVKVSNSLSDVAKKFWANHEVNCTKYLRETYGNANVGRQITVDVTLTQITQ